MYGRYGKVVITDLTNLLFVKQEDASGVGAGLVGPENV